MNKPIISIITPVYMTEQYLKECIDSIISQTFTDFELILVDDCSPDKSAQICDDYAKLDNRVKVIHKTKNEGLPKARETGLGFSSGDYIYYIDSDDWIEHDAIERLYKRLISENCDIVYCDLIRFDGGQLSHYLPYDSRGKEMKEIIIDMILNKCPQNLPTKLFKRNLFNSIIFPEYQFREDTVTCLQLFLNAKKVGYEYSILYHYRNNHGSITNKRNYPNLKKEEHLNFQKLDQIISMRSDYEVYRSALTEVLNGNKSYRKLYISFNLMRFFRAFVPYGLLSIYRKLKSKGA